MTSRLIVPLLLASALAFACGPLSHSKEVDATPEQTRADTVAGDVAATLQVHVGDEVEFDLAIANTAGRRIELAFPDGQTHDVAVLDATGQEIWRWSRGRMFTTAVQTKLLGADEQTSYRERWAPAGRTGTFTAVASLRSGNYPIEVRRGFTIEDGK